MLANQLNPNSPDKYKFFIKKYGSSSHIYKTYSFLHKIKHEKILRNTGKFALFELIGLKGN